MTVGEALIAAAVAHPEALQALKRDRRTHDAGRVLEELAYGRRIVTAAPVKEKRPRKWRGR